MSGLVVAMPSGAPIPEIVLALEQLLELAKQGQLRSLAVAAVMHNNCVRTAFDSGDASVFETLGAIEVLHHRFLIRNIEV